MLTTIKTYNYKGYIVRKTKSGYYKVYTKSGYYMYKTVTLKDAKLGINQVLQLAQ